MSVDWLIKLWDKGGVPLVMIVLLFLLLRFVGKRAIRALDNMATAQTESMREIASAVHTSSAAHVIALGGLTERVSRMEGKVDTLGQLAVRESRPQQGFNEMHQTKVFRDAQGHAHTVAIASAVEVFDEQETTPITPMERFSPEAVPLPVADRIPSVPRTPTRIPTPPKGIGAYSSARAKTGGKP